MGALKAFDLGMLALSFGLAMLSSISVPNRTTPLEILSMKIRLWNFLIFAGLLAVWHVTFTSCGFYESKRLSTRLAETSDVLKGSTLAAMFLSIIARVLALKTVTLGFTVLFWICSVILLISGRLIGRQLLARIRCHGRNLHFIVILGTNSRATEFAKKIQAKPELGYRIVGFVDETWAGTQDFVKSGYKICCDFAGLPSFLRGNVVDEVGIFLPLRSFYEYTSRVISIFEQHGIVMRFDSDLFNLKIARSRTDVFDGHAQITAHSGRFEGWSILCKRVVDLVISLLLLILVAPVFGLVALAIKMTSEGPIFFKQKRVGLGKRPFIMYKFRTMVANAEQLQKDLLHLNEMTGPAFKIKNDPRITRLGRFLRKTSLDELPQLLNVLAGDMSLVGPRAMSVRDYEFFSEDWQRRRFSVRPGVTCLWQVKGRNSISFEQWMQLDMQYIDKWSFWLDLKILVQTVPAVLRGTGAA
jgi:exopolysaccharide biosynthesis polyprenyl glycosylphosphotransferase